MAKSLVIHGQLKLSEVQSPVRTTWPNGRETVNAIKLDALRQELAITNGLMRHPITGEDIAVSLFPWRNADSASTWIEVAFLDLSFPTVAV